MRSVIRTGIKMLYDITDPKFRAAVLAFMLARKAAARRADLESEIDRVKRWTMP